MKHNLAFRLAWRLLLNMAFGAVLALAAMALLVAIAQFLNQFRSFRFIDDIGGGLVQGTNGFVLVFIWFMLFILMFGCLQWLLFSYLDKVNDTIYKIADGQLEMNHKIPVRSGSSFGVLAGNVNRLPDRLQQSMEDERRAEQTKHELITNVSHDLRTPLTSVVGYLGLIDQDRYRDEVELRHYVQIAYEKSQRLNELINDLFEFTRMRYDTISIKLEPLNLVELLGQLLVQYDMPLQEAGMEAKLHSRENIIMARADAAKLVRVFENLISNALAYGQEGKKIDVYVERHERMAQINIVNYGEPISALDLPHVFDRFYRADKSRTRWSGGSGLGLAISKSIIEKHGGTITVFSDDSRTAFSVSLPVG